MPKIITADHTELDVEDWGAGQPVIPIHGWPLSPDSWDDQAAAGGPLPVAPQRQVGCQGGAGVCQPASGSRPATSRWARNRRRLTGRRRPSTTAVPSSWQVFATLGCAKFVTAKDIAHATHKARLTTDLLDFLRQ